MPKFEDLTGKTFGDLTVIERAEKYSNGKIAWKCKCKCGRYVRRITHDLKTNRHPRCYQCSTKVRPTKHGMANSKLYYIWVGMKGRCYNERNKSFRNYGGRGVKICDEWLNDFETFSKWALGNGYQEGLSIDRADVNGDYEPQNCRWITLAEQNYNRRNNVLITHGGETKCLAEWAKQLGFSAQFIAQRYHERTIRSEEIVFEDLFDPSNRAAKPVEQYSMDGTFVKAWPSIAEAKRNGYDGSGISMCCSGKRKSANGYVWKYAGG